jgi:cysteine-rich repeat protein
VRFALLMFVFATSACLHDDLVDCGDGTACPVGKACDPVHGGCVMPEQLTVCGELAADADCMTESVVGGCFDGVCLPRGCGNRVVELDEDCDDGNEVGGDGCRADCQSNETCGNGAIDVGEECDDGNFLSRDGCDSRCITEQERIRIVALTHSLDTHATYDPVRKRVVSSVTHGVWELVDRTWQFIPTDSPSRMNVTTFDADRQKVLGATLYGVYSWDGAVWTSLGRPDAHFIVAIGHDPYSRRTLVWTTTSSPSQTFLSSLAPDGTWTPLGTFVANGEINTLATVAYDPATKEVILRSTLSTSSSRQQWVIDGNGWTQSDDPSTAGTIQMFVVDQELRAIERGSQLTSPKQMFVRRDGIWVLEPQTPPVEAYGFAYHDLDTNAVVLHTGIRSFELGVSSWAERPRLPSPVSQSVMADETGFHVLDVDGAFDGTTVFRSVRIDPDRTPPVAVVDHSPTVTARNAGVLTTSLARGGAVIANGNAGGMSFEETLLFDGSAWTTIESTVDLTTYNNTGYDPKNRRIVTKAVNDLWELPDDGSAWSLVGPTTGAFVVGLVWDARNDRLVGGGGSGLVELVGTEWIEAELYPQGIEHVSLAERAGGVHLVTNNVFDSESSLWERRGSQFTKLSSFPIGIILQSDAYRSRDGMSMWYGATDKSGKVAVFRDLTSPTPLETCEAGADVDGDGLAFCDDPDCYWRCSRCPPYTTCRFDLSP